MSHFLALTLKKSDPKKVSPSTQRSPWKFLKTTTIVLKFQIRRKRKVAPIMMKVAKKVLCHHRRSFAFKNNEFIEASELMDSIQSSSFCGYRRWRLGERIFRQQQCRRLHVDFLVRLEKASRNAWISMYGSRTTMYFDYPAPQFEDWVSAGFRNAMEP